MDITDVKIFPVEEEKLKAYVTITLDHCFVVRDLKVIQGTTGLFVAMPAKKRKDGTYKDIAHPLNTDMRDEDGADRSSTEYERSTDPRRASPATVGVALSRARAAASWSGTDLHAQRARLQGLRRELQPPARPTHLRVPQAPAWARREVGRFSDGEIQVEIGENVRGQDTFIIQSTCPAGQRQPDGAADHVRRAQARVGRLHHRGHPLLRLRPAGPEGGARAPPSPPSWWPTCSRPPGATRVVSMDMHAGQIQGFFNIPFDHLYASPVFLEDMRQNFPATEDLVIVSPDAGGVERARAYSKRLDATLAIVDKRRTRANVVRGDEPHRRRGGRDAVLHRRHGRHRPARSPRPRWP